MKFAAHLFRKVFPKKGSAICANCSFYWPVAYSGGSVSDNFDRCRAHPNYGVERINYTTGKILEECHKDYGFCKLENPNGRCRNYKQKAP